MKFFLKSMAAISLVTTVAQANEYSHHRLDYMCKLSSRQQTVISMVKSFPETNFGISVYVMSSSSGEHIIEQYQTTPVAQTQVDKLVWSTPQKVAIATKTTKLNFPLNINGVAFNPRFQIAANAPHTQYFTTDLSFDVPELNQPNPNPFLVEPQIKDSFRDLLTALGSTNVPDFNIATGVTQVITGPEKIKKYNSFSPLQIQQAYYYSTPSRTTVQMHYPVDNLDGLSYHVTLYCEPRSSEVFPLGTTVIQNPPAGSKVSQLTIQQSTELYESVAYMNSESKEDNNYYIYSFKISDLQCTTPNKDCTFRDKQGAVRELGYSYTSRTETLVKFLKKMGVPEVNNKISVSNLECLFKRDGSGNVSMTLCEMIP